MPTEANKTIAHRFASAINTGNFVFSIDEAF